MRKSFVVLAGVLLALGVFWQAALAQDTVSQAGSDVDGTVWLRSSQQEKESFLIGAGSVVALEYRVCEKKSVEPTPFVKGWVTTLKGLSWKELADKIDTYYMKHPDKASRGVFDVLWQEIIRPNLKD